MAIKVPLTNGGFALISKRDKDLVEANGPWYKKKSRERWYVVSTRQVNRVRLHVLILVKKKDKVIDHKNEDGLDNRRKNIRHLSPGDNRRRSSKDRGYTPKGRVWYVRVRIKGKTHKVICLTEQSAKDLIKLLKRTGIK